MISIIQQKKLNNKKLISRIRRYSDKIMQILNISNKKVTIIFVDLDYISNLNSLYFHKNYPTNVISFPFEEDNELGEIYISIDVAAKEAEEWGVTLFFELMYLIIHGLLHLLGYDHTVSDNDDKIMTEKEIEIIEKAGLKKWKKLE